MNEEFDLRKRLENADPARDAELISESVVAKAALSKGRGMPSFKLARLTMAAASLSIVGLAVTSVSLIQPQVNQPLFSLAGAAVGSEANISGTMERSAAEPGRMGADSMMIWPGIRYEYSAGDISSEPGSGKVYQAELVGDPIAILTKIATYFGIEQQPQRDEWATDEFPSYSVQQETSSVGIYFSGTGSWYYSNWNDSYGCAVSIDEDGEIREEEFCDPKPTPELIPQESDLVAQAVRTFSDLGFRVDQSQARVWRSEWGASVTFPNYQNGINTGMEYYAGWDSKGSLNYIAGHSFRLVERGSFDTISALDAVARISDGRWMGAAPSIYYEEMAIAYDSATSEDLMRDSQAAEDSDIRFEEPEIQQLVIERAEAVMLSVFDAAGNYWYVPGYLLYNQQGWFDAIISLPEGVIELPEPFNYDIMPMEGETRD